MLKIGKQYKYQSNHHIYLAPLFYRYLPWTLLALQFELHKNNNEEADQRYDMWNPAAITQCMEIPTSRGFEQLNNGFVVE